MDWNATYYLIVEKAYPVEIVLEDSTMFEIDCNGQYKYSLKNPIVLTLVGEKEAITSTFNSGAPIVDKYGNLAAMYVGASCRSILAVPVTNIRNVVNSVCNSNVELV